MRVILLIFLFAIGCLLFYRISNIDKGRLGTEKFLYLLILFFYIIIPSFYLYSFDELKRNTYNFWVLKTELEFESLAYTLIIYFFTLLGMFLGLNFGKKVKLKQYLLSSKKLNLYYYFLIFISLLSTFITLIYIYKVGGLVRAIVEANLYRAHGLMEPPVGQWSKFQPYVLYSSLLLLPFKKKFNYFFIFISILYLMIEASRTNFALYFFALYMYHLNKEFKFSLKRLSVPLVCAIFLAYLGNSVTDYIETGEWKSSSGMYYSILSQFSPTFSNILNMNSFVNEKGLGFFNDISSIFPQELFGYTKTIKTWQILTEYYLGGFYTVGIPIDLFSYGYSQLSFLGAGGYGFLYGAVVGIGLKFINNLRAGLELGFHNDREKILLGRNFVVMLEIIFSLFAMYILGWASLDSTVFYGTSKFWVPITVFVLVMKLNVKGRSG